MSEQGIQSVLRCGRCNKPFDKQSTLKRHGYYCRSRQDEPATRTRSCNSCARRKARCDNKRPACSACLTKGIECHYPAKTPRGTGRGPQSVRQRTERDVPTAHPPETVSAPISDAISHHSLFNDAPVISDLSVSAADSGDVYLPWDGQDIAFADFILPQMNDAALQFFPALESTTPLSTPLQETIQPHRVSIPAPPLNFSGSLVQRPRTGLAMQRMAKLVLQQLKSYPLMMLRHNTLPPFIHPRLLSDVEKSDMEPLHNCMSLLHMLGSQVPGSRKLVWRNVRMECERFRKEYLGWNKRELLAAMQALAIYLIIRLDEDQTEHNDLDLDLLFVATVAEIAVQYNSVATMVSGIDSELSWDDWIWEESMRRLCVIYQVVDLLVFWRPAALCHLREKNLLIAPLPARKHLWEAGDEATWKAESKREERQHPGVSFALTADGELVKVDERQAVYTNGPVSLPKPSDASTPPWTTANWDEWCSEMDGLGSLVMLAASLTS
ncbi:uncharacterized protein B0T15DRAFT_126406 [Chaetomium strumarium]|uniref:Zn(2)-C6 fungal-type domain-containing protein n=1 Tax=Chaetomium strumarium TaxID=1170767 RepID=A0AAJ0M4Y2_9PEZI|nr:hypothetical protein B0T15DRAFT_126406 [Chaetomium strumarium]